jgi:hypothetical protein
MEATMSKLREVTATKEEFDFNAKRDEVVRTFFEPRLAEIGLSVAAIQQQSLDELRESLERVNDAITHPESFGTVKLKVTAKVPVFIVTADSEAHIEVGILPLLLERKQLILRRIREFVGERKISNLRDLIESIPDAELRNRIAKDLLDMEEQASRIAEQEIKVTLHQAEQIEKRDQALATLKAELFERRLRAWTGFFAREPMATYIGAFLLLVLAFTLIIGKSPPSEILSNAFLIILGYFFGQQTSRAGAVLPAKPSEPSAS